MTSASRALISPGISVRLVRRPVVGRADSFQGEPKGGVAEGVAPMIDELLFVAGDKHALKVVTLHLGFELVEHSGYWAYWRLTFKELVAAPVVGTAANGASPAIALSFLHDLLV